MKNKRVVEGSRGSRDISQDGIVGVWVKVDSVLDNRISGGA